MKQISDSDHALLVDKLPRVLAAVRCSPADTRTINAARRLKALSRKLSRKLSQKVPNPKRQLDSPSRSDALSHNQLNITKNGTVD